MSWASRKIIQIDHDVDCMNGGRLHWGPPLHRIGYAVRGTGSDPCGVRPEGSPRGRGRGSDRRRRGVPTAPRPTAATALRGSFGEMMIVICYVFIYFINICFEGGVTSVGGRLVVGSQVAAGQDSPGPDFLWARVSSLRRQWGLLPGKSSWLNSQPP